VEIFSILPLGEALDADVGASLSPSPSLPPLAPGGSGGGGPGGGLIIMAWVITLLAALIALMLSSPDGNAAFCREVARRPVGSMSAKG
jgi:hypothetical protein